MTERLFTDNRTNTLLAVSPNLLRAELKSEEKDVFLFYDGKNFTVYGKLVNYYATVPAPATTGQLVDKVYSDYGTEIPLVDLFSGLITSVRQVREKLHPVFWAIISL
jgi:hypothetical protein